MSRDEKLAPASNTDYKLLQTNRNNLDASLSSDLDQVSIQSTGSIHKF